MLLLVASAALADFAFVHPGLLQSREDLARMKSAVAAESEPLFSGYEIFRTNAPSQMAYKMRGPRTMIGRNPSVGQGDYNSDANAAYQCAIMWCLTGDRAYANKSKEIINAWSATLKSITGRDAILMAGLGPFKMINAAEILRHTDASWSPGGYSAIGNPFSRSHLSSYQGLRTVCQRQLGHRRPQNDDGHRRFLR